MMKSWVKIRDGVWQRLQTIALAERLSCSTDEAVGLLCRLWCLTHHEAESGLLRGYTAATLDRHLQKPGFTAALAAGIDDRGAHAWLIIEADGIRIPRYERWIGSAKQNSEAWAERKRNYRGRIRNTGTPPPPEPPPEPPPKPTPPSEATPPEPESAQPREAAASTPPPPPARPRPAKRSDTTGPDGAGHADTADAPYHRLQSGEWGYSASATISVTIRSGWAGFARSYPRRVGPRAAAAAYERAVKRHARATGTTPGYAARWIAARAAAYAQTVRSVDTTKIPHPSTWLNEDRFTDEPVAYSPRGPAGPPREYVRTTPADRFTAGHIA